MTIIFPLAFTVVACSGAKTSKTTAAAGPAKTKTAKAPANAAAPSKATGKKSGTNVTGNVSSAAETQATCEAAEVGLGVCDGGYVVFCAPDAKVYALDCAAAFGDGATCGAVNDEIDCVVVTEE